MSGLTRSLGKDLFGADWEPKLPEDPVASRTGTALAVRGSQVGEQIVRAVKDLEGKVVSGMGGVAISAIVGAVGLLPDAERHLAEVKKRPQKEAPLRERVVYALNGRRVIEGLLLGGDDQTLREVRAQRNIVADAFESALEQSSFQRSSPDRLLSLAASVLGEEVLNDAVDLYHASMEKRGEVTDEERRLAVEIESKTPRREIEERDVRTVLMERVSQSVLSVGQRVALKMERDQIEDLLRHPTKALPEDDGSEKITLVEQRFIPQLVAALVGSTAFDLKTLFGGSELYLDQDGIVWLRKGVEREIVANRIDELVLQTDIAPRFENASLIVEKRINLGKVSDLARTVATLKETQKVKDPGAVVVQRAGADEEDRIAVASVSSAVNGVMRLLRRTRDVKNRKSAIEAAVPHVAQPMPVFAEIEREGLTRTVVDLPRLAPVVDETKTIRHRRIVRESEVFQKFSFTYPPSEDQLKTFREMPESMKTKVREKMLSMQPTDVVDFTLSVFDRLVKQLPNN